MNTKVYYLSNGIPVIICNTSFHTCKILISLGFGASDEAPHEYGITHFIEHLLGQSVTGEKNFGYLKNKIEALGGCISLYTNYEKIACFVNTLPEHLIDAIEIIAPQITSPSFNTKSIEHEKHIILDEYKRYTSNNSWHFFKHETLFKNTELEHCVLGTEETIQSFTTEMLLEYYFSHLSKNKTNIVVVGPIYNSTKLLTELEKKFGKIPSTPSTQREHKYLAIQPTFKHDLKTDLKNIKIAFAFSPKISYDRKTQNNIGLFRKILQDRLMNALRYKNGLVYSIQCLTMGIPNTKLYTIETEITQKNIEPVIKTIANVCKNILTTEPVTQEELQHAKNVIKFNNALIMDSVDKSCNLHSQHMLHYNSMYNINYEAQILNEIQPSDIQNTAHIFLNANLSIVSQGSDLGCNIMKLWQDFFKHS